MTNIFKHILFIISILIMALATLIFYTRTTMFMSPTVEIPAIITVTLILGYKQFIKNSRERK